VEKLTKLIRARKGFTLVELIVVVTILAVITVVAVPGFMKAVRTMRFERTVGDVVVLIERARTQALASELNSAQKIPPGGYGVFIDFTSVAPATAQKAILFVDDWNAAEGKAVNVNYADEDIANRVLPDGIYTDGSDSVLAAIDINSPSYIQIDELKGTLLSDGSAWASAAGNTVTTIFKPPYAETTIFGNASTDLQSFEAKFKLTTDNLIRKIILNRVTTTPQVFKEVE